MREALVSGLRQLSFDVLTADEANKRRASDAEQLAFAATQQRAIYTQNVRDYRVLHRRWLDEGRAHAGIILLTDQRASVGRQLQGFRSLGAALSEHDLRDQLVFLLNYA